MGGMGLMGAGREAGRRGVTSLVWGKKRGKKKLKMTLILNNADIH
jgi:hypothetical protein